MSKRKKAPPTKAQTRAYNENFALFLLWGWLRTLKLFIKPVVGRGENSELSDAICNAILDIKRTQQLRRKK